MTKIRFIDLFAWIWGFHIALNSQWCECVFASEIDANARKTYEYNFKDSNPSLFTEDNFPHDVTQIQWPEVPDHDILCAGFPCQAFSIAGYRKWFEDERWNLFFDIARIIKSKKPQVVFLENVKNLKTHDAWKTFETILDTLDRLWYYVKTTVLNSYEYWNIPQNRERIYIVAFRNEKQRDAFKFPDAIPLKKSISDLLEKNIDSDFYYNEKPLYERIKDDITKTNTAYQWRRKYVRENKKWLVPTLTANMGTGGHNVPIILDDTGIRKLTPQECLYFQGYPNTYSFPKLSKWQQYKQVWNSVSVPVISRIAENIIKVI